jgi:hypothetical protein
MDKEEVQQLQVKAIKAVMVLVQVAVVLLVVVVQVLKAVEVRQVAIMNVVVMEAQEYHPLFQELPQRMVVVVVEFHKIVVGVKVGEQVASMVDRLVHLAVVVMLLEVAVLITTV